MESTEAEKLSTVDDVVSHAKDYVKTNVDLFALNVADKTSGFAADTAFYFLLFTIALFFMFFVSAGIAFALAPAVGGIQFAFFLIAGFYFLLGILAWLLKDKWIKTPVANRIIKQLFKEKTGE